MGGWQMDRFSTLWALLAHDAGAKALIVRIWTANFSIYLLHLLEKSSRIDGGNPPPEFGNALLGRLARASPLVH